MAARRRNGDDDDALPNRWLDYDVYTRHHALILR